MRGAACTALLLATALLGAGAAAQVGGAGGGKPAQPQFGITVSRDPIVQGEPFELVITIATESRDEPQVQLPALGGLRILRQYESHPMSFSFSFGLGQQAVRQTKRQSEYTFVVVADRPGRFTINPVAVVVDGKRYQSTAYALDVRPASGAAAVPPAGQGAAEPAPPPPDTALPPTVDLDGAQVEQDYFLHAVVSSKRCRVGEAIVLRVYLFTSWNVSGVQLVREPGTDGFWVENIETGAREAPHDQVQIGGRTYERVELRRIALFPLRDGQLTIAPALAELEVQRGGFFSRPKRVRRAAAPVVVAVEPLPEAGRPAGFDPTNVGQFAFRAELDRDRVAVGEPVTLTMTARGAGNVRNLVLPRVADIDGVKIYDPEPEIEVIARDEGVSGTLVNKVLMIPKREGVFTIPELRWSTYDPAAGEYKTLTSPARQFIATPAAGGAAGPAPAAAQAPGAPVDDGGAFGRMAQRLRSIATRADLGGGGRSIVLDAPWFLALVAVAPLAWLAVVAVQLGARRRRANLVRDRAKRADGVALRQLDELAARGRELDGDRFFAALQRTLVQFLEDRLEAAVAGDTMAELAARLKRRGFGDELAEATVAEMESCDFARFARSASGDAERQQALARVRDLIARLAAVHVVPEEVKP